MEGIPRSMMFVLLLSLLLVGMLSIVHQLVFEGNEASGTVARSSISIAATAKFLASLPWLLKQWISPNSLDDIARLDAKNGSTIYPGLPLVTNLSSCAPSFSTGHQLVHCCPATDDASQPIFDFPFPDPSAPKRIRRPSHRVDEAYKAKYELAVRRMKALHPDHPHNFYRQANMHCLYCTGGYVQSNSTALYNIHRNWLFFPWHRALIFFHERILGKLVGDDQFSLNYWQWDLPEAMQIPDMYLNGSLVDEWRDPGHLPPKVADLHFSLPEHDIADDEQIEENLAFMYHQMVSGARKTELFMGCRITAGVEGLCNGPGTIEAAPHNTLHTWVGSPHRIERENMGTFYSAARDPVFYAHHANIDRLWIVWKKLNENRPEFMDTAWLNTVYYFYDENLRLIRVRVRDVLDYTKLGYDYEEAELPWLSARPKPSMSPMLSRKILSSMMSNSSHVIQMPAGTDDHAQRKLQQKFPTWTLDKNIRVRVHRPKPKRTLEEKAEEEEVLVVFGIDAKNRGGKFDVFVNLVDENKARPRYREFAGTFVSLPHGNRVGSSAEDMHSKSHIKLGLNEVLEDLEADGDDSIMVTLVPSGNSETSITVDGIRIEYMK